MRCSCIPAVLALLLAGCADKEAADPGGWVREESARAMRGSGQTTRNVRVGCDDDGGLHIRAPEGSRVTVPSDAQYPAEAEIDLPEEEVPHTRLRRTKSLGFIGDNKLTETPSRGGPWNVPDALLPPHRHVEPHYNVRGYGYGYGYAVPVRYGARVFVPPPPSAQASSFAPSQGSAPPPPAPIRMTGVGGLGAPQPIAPRSAPVPGWGPR